MRKSTHTPGHEAVREAIRSRRKAAGLSQRALAEAIDAPHSIIAKIESGERRLDVVEFCWIVTACGADPAVVLSGLQAQVGSAVDSNPLTESTK